MRAHLSPPILSLVVLVLAHLAGCDPRRDPAKARNDGRAGSSATTRQSHAAFFPIETGVHQSADCNSCHGNLGTFKEFNCLSCHEHAQPLADSTHAGFQGYKYDSKSCLGCHPSGQGASVSRDDHTARFFPITAGSHGSASCASCHANPSNFADMTCLSCHEHSQPLTDPTHAGLQGYKYDSKSCLGCHPKGEAASISRVDHSTRYFPIALGNHATADCSSCHANPANIQELTCLSCHDHAQAVTDPQHQGLAGYSYDTASCLRCHPAGEPVLARAEHNRFFPIVNGDHNLPCSSCHMSPPDYKKFECVNCHEHAQAQTDNDHEGEVRGYVWNSAACYRCHPRGTED